MESRKNNSAAVVKHLITELVLAGLILCVFSLFHHVIPKLYPESNEVIEGTRISSADNYLKESSSSDVGTAAEGEFTEWQRKFAEHFSSEIVSGENSYKSPEVSVEITTHEVADGKALLRYYVADIYIARIENFATYFPNDEFRHYGSDDALKLDAESNAVVAINGDYSNAQFGGVLVRNGIAYMQGQTECDICVLYLDGTMKTFGANEYKADDLMKGDVWQIWKFGPALLDGSGAAKERFNCTSYISSGNPRSAIGYYEPGHYCFVTVDGRQNGTQGMKIKDLSRLFEELGCTSAYNLDGGASAVMTFDDRIYTSPSEGGRELGDILLIREYNSGGEVSEK